MNIDFYKIAQSYFQGTITAEDEQLLSQFLQESEDHRVLFKQWSAEWHDKAKAQASSKTQAAWMRLTESQKKDNHSYQIEAKPAVENKRRTVSPPKRYWYYAAAAVALLLIGSAIWLFKPDQIETPYMAQTERHEQRTVTLPDGTQVTLNGGSTLACADDFGKKDRRISFEGEGVFEVQKDAGKPFVIQVGDYSVTVLGTHFNLSAYQQDNAYTLALIEGSVKVKYLQDSVMMQPNELLRFDRQTSTFEKEPFQASTADAWTQGRLEFDNILLQDLASKLERQYDVTIEFENPQIASEQVYISISVEQSFADVCDALEALLPIEIDGENNVFMISAR
jgi:ferric-dicitrate binding protein FerR (iron transport regulator)